MRKPELAQTLDWRALAVEVHRHDRTRTGREGALHRERIHQQGVVVAVGEDRRRATPYDCNRGRDEGEGGDDHLSPAPTPSARRTVRSHRCHSPARPRARHRTGERRHARSWRPLHRAGRSPRDDTAEALSDCVRDRLGLGLQIHERDACTHRSVSDQDRGAGSRRVDSAPCLPYAREHPRTRSNVRGHEPGELAVKAQAVVVDAVKRRALRALHASRDGEALILAAVPLGGGDLRERGAGARGDEHGGALAPRAARSSSGR